MKILEIIYSVNGTKRRLDCELVRIDDKKAIVDAFWSGLCPHSTVAISRLRKVCAEFKEKVIMRKTLKGKSQVFILHLRGNGELQWGELSRTLTRS